MVTCAYRRLMSNQHQFQSSACAPVPMNHCSIHDRIRARWPIIVARWPIIVDQLILRYALAACAVMTTIQIKMARLESFAPRQSPKGGAVANIFETYPSMDLKIHEDSDGNVFVKDLSIIPVQSLHEVMDIINQVNEHIDMHKYLCIRLWAESLQ